MKRKPQSLTVHLRHAAHRVHRAAWIINDGAIALHCGRVLALTREHPGKVRELFFSDSMALEDKAVILHKDLSATDRQQAARTAKLGAEVERLYETARRLSAKLESCYVRIKQYTVRVAAEEKKNPKFKRPARRPQRA